jgi:hypothetical protein
MSAAKGVRQLFAAVAQHDYERAEALWARPEVRERISRKAFPQNYGQLTAVYETRQPELVDELVGQAFIFSKFSEKLNGLLRLKGRFYACVFASRFEDARNVLAEVRKSYGWSLWQVESQFALNYELDNHEENRKLIERLIETSGKSRSINLFAATCFLRSGPGITTHIYRQLCYVIERELRKVTGGGNDAEYLRYSALVWNSPVLDALSFRAVVVSEQDAALVDRYRTFVLALNRFLADSVEGNTPLVGKLLSDLKDIEDPDLDKLRFVINEPISTPASQLLASADEYLAYLRSEPRLQAHAEEVVDVDRLILQARAYARGLLEHGEVTTLESRIVKALAQVFGRATEFESAVGALDAVLRRYSMAGWAPHLFSAVTAETNAVPVSIFHSRIAQLHGLTAAVTNPQKRRYFPATISSLSSAPGDPCEHALLQIYDLWAAHREQAIDQVRRLKLPGVTGAFIVLHLHASGGAHEEVVGTYVLVSSWSEPYYRCRGLVLVANSAIELGELGLACKVIWELWQDNNRYLGGILWTRLLQDLLSLDQWPTMRRSPLLAVVLHLYESKYGLEQRRVISDAFQDFLEAHSVRSALDLPANAFGDVAIRGYFLEHVCTTDVMEGTRYLPSMRAVEAERLRICQAIENQFPEFEARARNEIRSILEHDLVRRRLKTLDEGRVYVDTDALREELFATLKERFPNVRDYLIANRGKQLAIEFDALSRDQGRLMVETNPTLVALEPIYRLVRDAFVLSKRFGMNTYVSAEMRHGMVEAQLKSSLLKWGLVETSVSASGRGAPSWNAQISSLDEQGRRSMERAFERFNMAITKIVTDIRDDLLQMKLQPDVTKGGFALEIRRENLDQIASHIQPQTSTEEFIQMMMIHLWSITDVSLARLRGVVDKSIRHVATSAFDQLIDDVETCAAHGDVGALRTAVISARADFEGDLSVVVKWLQRAQPDNFEDFRFMEAWDTAHEMIRRMFPNLRFAVTSQEAQDDRSFKGFGFRHMVRVLALALENVAIRSNLADPEVSVSVQVDEGKLTIRIVNTVATLSEPQHLAANADLDRRMLELQSEHLSGVDTEKGSGLPKIKKIITSDLASDCEIVVRYDNPSSFRLELQMSTDQVLV